MLKNSKIFKIYECIKCDHFLFFFIGGICAILFVSNFIELINYQFFFFTEELLRKKLKLFYCRLAIKENSFVSVVNGIYRGCFLVFYSLWRARQCTITDFCKISEGILKFSTHPTKKKQKRFEKKIFEFYRLKEFFKKWEKTSKNIV